MIIFQRARAQHRLTALILTAANGHTDCVRLLLGAGADHGATDDVRRVLSILNFECACFLLWIRVAPVNLRIYGGGGMFDTAQVGVGLITACF